MSGIVTIEESFGGNDIIKRTSVGTSNTASGSGATTDGTFGQGFSSEYTEINLISDYTSNDNQLADTFNISLKVYTQDSGSSSACTVGNAQIQDIYFKYTIENDTDGEPTATFEKNANIKYLYNGADGLTNSFTGGSGVADTGLEAHRDLLVRFAGFDDSDGDIYNYDDNLDIKAARITTAWNIRWWALKPVELEKVLEQIQYEFCFIFKWRNGLGSYWYVKDSYSSGDVVQTLKKDDIVNLRINNIPFSELLTQMEINYEKHPAESRYLSSQTSKDTTNNPRTTWNIQNKENISEVNLDMNVNKPGNTNPGGGDTNDGFADYYMNIFGDIKKVISCDIVNPAVSYNLETGDIIQFSNTAGEMPVEPFGDNWADYYMITDLQRSPGKIKIQAREVG